LNLGWFLNKREEKRNMDIKDVTPGTALWLCPLCGNLTAQKVNREGCVCECKERHGEWGESELQIYLGYSIVIEDDHEIVIEDDYEPAVKAIETTVYKFYDIREDTVWLSPIEGFDEIHVY
tara:strand:- start:100 stop:462 length:363 start_codon:yes stop_codon:yes gene_type:complete